MTKKECDHVGTIIHEWAQQKPDLDTGGLAVVGRILNLSDILRKRINKQLAPFDLKYSEFDVLATLRRAGPPYILKPTELMSSVILTSGAITAALEKLTQKGLVIRLADENDGRVKTVKLTAEGLEIIEQALEIRMQDANASIKALGAQEAESIAILLGKMALDLAHDK